MPFYALFLGIFKPYLKNVCLIWYLLGGLLNFETYTPPTPPHSPPPASVTAIDSSVGTFQLFARSSVGRQFREKFGSHNL